MSRIRFIIALAASILFIFFCFHWKPWEAIFVFRMRPLLVTLTIFAIIFASYGRSGGLWAKIQRIPMKLWAGAVMALTFIASVVLAYGPLEGLPHVPDDICYLFQATTFSEGRLYADSHPLREFFHLLFMINDGKWYSLFQPGWPALLALGVFIKLPFIINPALAALAVYLTYLIGMRALGEEKTRLGLLLVLFAPIHTSIPATLLAHPISLVLTLASMLITMKMLEEEKPAYTLGLGALSGLLFATRIWNAVILCAMLTPFLLWMLFAKKVRLRILALGLLPFLLLAGLQLAYNHHLTGNAFEWPQDRYFDTTEPKKHCHRPGFGKNVGCPNVHPGEDFPEGYGFKDALRVTHTRLGTFLLIVYGWNFLFFFVVIPFLTSRSGPWKYYLLAAFLALIAGYFSFYFHGLWGRYYYESFTLLMLLTAAGMIDLRDILLDRFSDAGKWAKRAIKSIVPAFVTAFVVFNVYFFFAGTMGLLGELFFGIDARLERMLHYFPEKSVVFMERWYATGFIFMTPDWEQNKILFVHDMGRQNKQMMQFHPDWNFFSYDPKENKVRKLEKDEIDTSTDSIFLEGENKVPIMFSSGEYSYAWPLEKDDDGAKISGGMLFQFVADGKDSWAAFDQFVFDEGNYRIKIRYLAQDIAGNCLLDIDGKVLSPQLDGYSEKKKLIDWISDDTIHLTRGQHRFTLHVTGKDTRSAQHRISIDHVEIIKENRQDSLE